MNSMLDDIERALTDLQRDVDELRKANRDLRAENSRLTQLLRENCRLDASDESWRAAMRDVM